jgi:hypothetical protein
MVLDQSNVYWSSNSYPWIFSCPKTGGCSSDGGFLGTIAFTGAGYFGSEFAGLTTDNTYLYTVDIGGSNGVFLGQIEPPTTSTFSKETTLFSPQSLAFDTANTWVYLFTGSSVARMKPDASQFTQFASGAGAPMAIDAQNLYLTGTNAIVACSLAGTACSKTPVMTVTAPSSVYSDGTYVWVTALNSPQNSTSGTVLRCNVNTNCGSSPTSFATGQDHPSGIIADSKNVYWSTSAQILGCPVSGCAGPPTVLASEGAGQLFTADSSALLTTVRSRNSPSRAGHTIPRRKSARSPRLGLALRPPRR